MTTRPTDVLFAASADNQSAPEETPTTSANDPDDYEGATEDKVGDLGGPGAGYDNEPEQEPDTSGVIES